MTEEQYRRFVLSREANPAGMRPFTVDEGRLLHAVSGITSEAGEIMGVVKRRIAYGEPVDRAKLLMEMGDMEFFLALARECLGVTREQVLTMNVAKLTARHPNGWTPESDAARDEAAELEAAQCGE